MTILAKATLHKNELLEEQNLFILMTTSDLQVMEPAMELYGMEGGMNYKIFTMLRKGSYRKV